MRLYYLSYGSALLLAFIYQSGTVGMRWIWGRMRWRFQRTRRWMLPVFALLYALPMMEEFWIAWNFEGLCGSSTRWISAAHDARLAKDAGLPIASTGVAHKIAILTTAASTTATGHESIRYVRWPPWFNIDAEAPLLACDAPRR